MNLHHGSASAADSGQQYSAARNLTIFESVEDAIELPRCEGAITHEEARSLRTTISNGVEWRLFRRAVRLLAQGKGSRPWKLPKLSKIDAGMLDWRPLCVWRPAPIRSGGSPARVSAHSAAAVGCCADRADESIQGIR